MRKWIIPFILLVVVFWCVSCDETESSTTYIDTTDATVAMFYFASSDSFPGLGEAEFVVENYADSSVGLIHVKNFDSLRYGTSLVGVVPKVIFSSSPSGAGYLIGDTAYTYTGYDTLDFSKGDVYLSVLSYDGTCEKKYRIWCPVHQADPDLYKWSSLCTSIQPSCSAEQKAFCLRGQYYFFTNDGFSTALSVSSDAHVWQQQAVSGLPAVCHVSTIAIDSASGQMYVAADSVLYTSINGSQWSKIADIPLYEQYHVLTLWMVYHDMLWAMVSDSSSRLCLASLSLSSPYAVRTLLSADDSFPLSDFSSVHYQCTSGNWHHLIGGGYNRKGEILNSIFVFESVGDSCRVLNMANSRHAVEPFAGASMVWYDDRLLAFSGVDSAHHLLSLVRESNNEGYSWSEADTTHGILPPFFPRYRTSAFVQGKTILFVGGQNVDSFFTDVHQGYRNELVW